MERRLASVARHAPAFATALRAYRRAVAGNDRTTAEALLAWIGGQPNVGAAAKRYAGVKGTSTISARSASSRACLSFCATRVSQGSVVVLDEVETLQRVRSDVREKSLNALRQVIDEIDSGRFPGLYLVITGTPAFFEGPQGVQRLPPLAQRLAVDFSGAPRFDNPRAPQVRLHNFDLPRLQGVGRKIRDLYAEGATAPARVLERADDAYLSRLARAVTGGLGGRVGIAPRVFLKKLVQDVLDRIDLHPDFDPRRDYALTLTDGELTDVERNARASDDSRRRRAGTVNREPAFDRLHPALQHHIVNSLGWTSLRPLQEHAIGPVLDGDHALLLAPTAGGKTEAAVFPLLSRMLTEQWGGLSVLYVCPIKALLNNLESRLRAYGGPRRTARRPVARRRRCLPSSGHHAGTARPAVDHT